MINDSTQGLGNFGYGVFYTAPVAFMYLLTIETRPPLNVPYLFSLNSDWGVIILLISSLYSSIWLHRASLLIYGDQAGLESSRLNSVSNRHLTFFATGVEPDELPNTASLTSLMIAAISSENMRWGVLLRFIPASVSLIYSIIAWIWISIVLFSGTGNYISGALWLVLSIFLFRNLIAGYLPNYIPQDSAEKISEADYIRNNKKAQESLESTSNNQRIRSNRELRPSHRYRTK